MRMEFDAVSGAIAQGVAPEVFGSRPVEDTQGPVLVGEARLLDFLSSPGTFDRSELAALSKEELGVFLPQTEDNFLGGFAELIGDFAILQADEKGNLEGAGAESGGELGFLGDVIEAGLAEDFLGVRVGLGRGEGEKYRWEESPK
jgi:hypothetical protein